MKYREYFWGHPFSDRVGVLASATARITQAECDWTKLFIVAAKYASEPRWDIKCRLFIPEKNKTLRKRWRMKYWAAFVWRRLDVELMKGKGVRKHRSWCPTGSSELLPHESPYVPRYDMYSDVASAWQTARWKNEGRIGLSLDMNCSRLESRIGYPITCGIDVGHWWRYFGPSDTCKLQLSRSWRRCRRGLRMAVADAAFKDQFWSEAFGRGYDRFMRFEVGEACGEEGISWFPCVGCGGMYEKTETHERAEQE